MEKHGKTSVRVAEVCPPTALERGSRASEGPTSLSFVNVTANPPLMRHSDNNVQKYMLVGIAGFKIHSLPHFGTPV